MFTATQTLDGKQPVVQNSGDGHGHEHEHVKKDRKTDFIYESANVSFEMSQFLWELSVNSLYPLFIWYAPVPHMFWPIHNFPSFLFIHGSPILVLLTLVSAFLSSKLDTSACVFPIVVFFMHRTMVAVKYGCYTHSEYR